ncbi:ArnT family glycosyltransferase [Muriicola sp. Z0-33]|uniref:ArnT family glycosyltransferase n=1 Tax=Muriicola sp. Z0-33 TaxID=2816957 RepID=UPI002237FAEB|nr:glycosyltransferase family 39 protein [Muriicola sp. Z0-33]MCW5515021.1 glycosyltransferase family 39 protein [Muriicola sp. Z0-33]
MKHKLPRIFLFLLGIIFIINLAQGYFTELIFDEAYYWYYAQNLSWGYFDHPPMVAFLIEISSIFFEGELGVRFMSSLLAVGAILLLWRLIDHPKKTDFVPHFFILVFSMTLLNVYGFLMLPDTPLLFFTALLLFFYKKFLERPSLLISIALGITMAALMYSKYHAALVIIFILSSNLKLLSNKYAWLAVFIALVCYTPHFIWLYEHDFVSIKYHLFERPNRAYHFEDFTLGYFINLVALFGLTFPWVYKALYKTKMTDAFTKALIFLVYGVLIFFFISSFNRRIQTQWLIVICIPMVVLVYNQMLDRPGIRKWIFRMGLVNIAIFFVLRVGLIYKPLFPIVYETHGNKKWVAALESEVGDTPVVFENSYRKAPMYAFYSGNTSLSLNNIKYRQNQYSIDSSEFNVQQKKVVYVSKYTKEGDISYSNAKGVTFYGNFIDDFESFRKLRCHVIALPEENQNGLYTMEVSNPYMANIELEKIRFAVAYLNKHKQVIEVVPAKMSPLKPNTTVLKSQGTTAFVFELPPREVDAPVYFKISISENQLYWGINSDNIKLP